MNNFAPLLLPALLGLMAGISHGMVSHYTGLPMSLNQQLIQPFEGGSSLKD
ncbi:MAG: hypothetical protein WBA76_07865 [Phormidesmis sp.]